MRKEYRFFFQKAEKTRKRTKIILKRRIQMAKYQCGPCGYTYDPAVGDPDSGIAPGTAFEDLPDDWCCPICGVTKDMFEKID